jgi:hypothetical protein
LEPSFLSRFSGSWTAPKRRPKPWPLANVAPL